MKQLTKQKKIILITAIIAVIFVVLASTLGWYFGVYSNPYFGTVKKFETAKNFNETLTEKQAKRDLNYVIKRLRERHPAWLEDDNDTAEKVEAIYNEEYNKIKGQQTVLSVWQATSRICSVIVDAHTAIRYYGGDKFINDLTDVNTYGYPVTINGIKTSALFEKSKSLYSYETENYLNRRIYASYLYSESNLNLLGFDTSNGVDFVYENGKTVHYQFVPIEEVKGAGSQSTNSIWGYHTIDKEKDLAVFTIKQCEVNNEYKAAVKAFFDDVKANGISNIAVDLRGNGGGNSGITDIFISYLNVDEYKTWSGYRRVGDKFLPINAETIKVSKKADAFSGKVYVMTDVITFSAAMNFAMLIGDNNIGEIVGEASGNLPDCYIDCLVYQLPESKLAYQVSFKRNFRIDSSKKIGEPLNPDYPCEPSQALDKIYELIG